MKIRNIAGNSTGQADMGVHMITELAAVIEVDELRKSYGGVERLHGISFEVHAGEIL
ncbi:MAG: hypothetical protein ACYCV7_17685 [Acidimicrobiales bacterium]